MIGIRKEIRNQNQNFLPILFASIPATICGINITHKRRISGIFLYFYKLNKLIKTKIMITII